MAGVLAERQRRRHAQEEQLRALRASCAAVMAELASGGVTGGGSGSSDLSTYQAYLRGLGEQIGALETQVAEALAEEAKLREDLLARMKEERVIKQLKTRKLKAYESALAREQQGEIDEVARAGWTARAFGESKP